MTVVVVLLLSVYMLAMSFIHFHHKIIFHFCFLHIVFISFLHTIIFNSILYPLYLIRMCCFNGIQYSTWSSMLHPHKINSNTKYLMLCSSLKIISFFGYFVLFFPSICSVVVDSAFISLFIPLSLAFTCFVFVNSCPFSLSPVQYNEKPLTRLLLCHLLDKNNRLVLFNSHRCCW